MLGVYSTQKIYIKMSVNINNINFDDFKDICRLCLFKCDTKFYQDSVVTIIFLKLTDLHFETNDNLPQQICHKCFKKLNKIHEFMVECKRTHSALMECLKQKQLNEAEVPNAPENTDITKKFKLVINLGKQIEFNRNNKFDGSNISETSEIKEEVIEDLQETSYNIEREEHNIEFIKVEHVCDEINNEQNINCSENPLLIPVTGNLENQEISNLKKDSLNCSNSLDASSEMKKKGVYKCDVCRKTFFYLKAFKQHKKLPDCTHPFKCNQCSKLFTQSTLLVTHMHSHSGERPFKCDQCSKTFTYPRALRRHMRTHTGERPFKCDQCSKSFLQPYQLLRHIHSHSGERPYECDQCSKSFINSGSLYRHKHTHTGERPFKCNLCPKSFARPTILQDHMRTHTGERPFKCDQCSKSFAQSGNLSRHWRMHSGDHLFKCDQCNKSFKLLINLDTHKRNQHKNNNKTELIVSKT